MNRRDILRPQGLRIAGAQTHATAFDERHLRDPIYLSWLRDREVMHTIGRPEYLAVPIAFEEVETYCRHLMVSDCDLFLALYRTLDGRFVGTLKAGHVDWHQGIADIGIMIGAKDCWGQGLATDAIGALARHLFDVIGLRRLTAGAMEINPAMIRAFEKLGFQREGRLRSHVRCDSGHCDHILLGCLRGELKVLRQ